MTLAPQLPSDDGLNEFIQIHAKSAPPEVFEPLITAPNQTGRFAAALQMAPMKKDPRVIPILLEIIHAQIGLSSRAQELLSDWPHDAVGVDWPSLDTYIFGFDVAAEAAAKLAFDASDQTYLVRTLEHVRDGAGQRLLMHLVDRVRISDEGTAARAHALLARASPTWTKSLMSDNDVAVRVRAAHVQAERGDPSALPVALDASKTCESILIIFLNLKCDPHLDDAKAVIDLMRLKLQPPVHFTVDAGVMTGLPQVILESLIQLLLVAEDDRTTRELLAVLHPLDRPEEGNALKKIGKRLDRNSLRQLMRVLPQESSRDRTAMLSGLADGLKLQGLPARAGVNFCETAKAEGRKDLLVAWLVSGHPCAAER
jgi:hypothetical protein